MAPAEVRVICEHGTVATFTESSIKGVWIISARNAERVTDENGSPGRTSPCGAMPAGSERRSSTWTCSGRSWTGWLNSASTKCL
jgi:hypothetical protein